MIDRPPHVAPPDPSAAVRDPERLAAVRATGLLDTPVEEAFDRMTRLAAKVIGAPAIFISLVDAESDFFKSTVGFPEPLATERRTTGRTFCHFALQSDGPLVLNDVTGMPGFQDVPSVHSLGVRAYLGVPLRTDAGHTIGSFCAVDMQPRVWSDQDVETLTELASSVMREVNLRAAVRDAVHKQEDAQRHERLATFAAEIGGHLIQPVSLPAVLRHCADTMVRHFDAALARIWTLSDASRTLELHASAGLDPRLMGAPSRVPVGASTIGDIALHQQARATNAFAADAASPDRAWAREHGLTAFAGSPLVVDGRTIGVVALFARQPLALAVVDALSAAANAIAIGVQRKRAEEALHAAGRRKDVFVATMAHELRQPLGAIVPALEVMRVRPSEPASDRAREIVGRQVAQLQRLVDDLTDVTGIAEGKIALRLHRTDLRQVVEYTAQGARALLEREGLTLGLSLSEGPVWLTGDDARLQQVFSNLLTNAVKYTRAPGRIEVELRTMPAAAVVIVRDTGKGITPEALPHIFDLFMQEASDQRAGLGIGLKVVRGLVELHGGSVEARSDGIDRGSEFVVTLPREHQPG